MVHASPTVAPQALISSAAGTTSLINLFKISPLPGAPDSEIFNRLPARAIFLRSQGPSTARAKSSALPPRAAIPLRSLSASPLCFSEARDAAQLEETIAQKVADESGYPIGLG